MDNLSQFKCKNCGAELDLRKAVGGVVECEYCHTPWTVPKEETSPEALKYLHDGNAALDVCKFEDAYTYFQKAAEFDANEPEAYFGMALASFKVQYLKDEVNDCLQPICHEISEKAFTDDKNYKKALELATVEQKKIYRKKGGEIEDIRDEFYALKNSGLSYDCFLCAKVSEGNEDLSEGKRIKQETQDSILASEIYYALRDKGYKPFFSQREIKNCTGSAYEALILYALYTSECMLIVCSNEDYLQTKWVKSEYSRFLEMIKGEGKERDSLSFVFNGKPIEKLPNGKKIQGIDYSRAQEAFLTIFEFVKNHTPEARRKREEEENRRKAEEEARKRALEEQQRAFEEQQKQLEEKLKELERKQAQNDGGGANLSDSALAEAIRKVQKEEEEKKRREKEEAEKKRRAEEEVARKQAQEERRKLEQAAKNDPYLIDQDKCIGCGLCLKECPAQAITRTNYIPSGHKLSSCAINNVICIRCGICKNLCKFKAITTLLERKREEEARKQRAEEEARKRRAEEEARRAYLAQFEIENGVLIKYKGKGGNVIIPDGVTSIRVNAFRDCTGLISITIPDSMTSIGDGAFNGCESLTTITIPNGATSIGKKRFSGCTGLTHITIPDSVTSIGDNAFEGCESLTEIVIPDSVTSIGNSAFHGCTGLKEITIPSGVTSIGEGTFERCKRLTAIAIPGSVTSIGVRAFRYCMGLKEIKIPDSVTSIGDGAFEECESLKAIAIPGSVTSIGVRAFRYCMGLKEITIPDSVTSIGDNAFEGCVSLTEIKIPDSVTVIKARAFSGCTGLKEISIPHGLASIGSFAFEGCKGLKEIKIPNGVTSIGKGTFISCRGVTHITIPDSVTEIRYDAFYGCGLTSLTIPDSVMSIGEYAFWYNNLQSVTIPKRFKGFLKFGLKKIFGKYGFKQINFTFT